ncbi:MAG: 16S rRNA (cytidine(1402)-2'-O)-methyltransferase [Verrucomicrobiota bacterium]
MDDAPSASGLLSVLATPIGNLEDLGARAARVLGEADLIAAEDTRHTVRLLQHLGLHRPLISYHQHNEARRTEELTGRIAQGARVALVSDAGTPAISDPGLRLIRACRQQGLTVEVIPGPSAVLAALAGSGLPATPFYFGGFLPVKSGQRLRELEAAAARDCTSVYFESPHRLVKTLTAAAESETLAACAICVARELTKIHEEFRLGSAAELRDHYTAKPPKGEICLLLAPTVNF